MTRLHQDSYVHTAELQHLHLLLPLLLLAHAHSPVQDLTRAVIAENCKRLTALPPLPAAVALLRLDLFGCEALTTLPGIEHLESLQELDLSYTAISRLPPLGRVTLLDG